MTVVDFPGPTYADEAPEKMLDKAKKWDLSKVMVIGLNNENDLVWGFSFGDAMLMNWMLDAVKAQVLSDTLSED